MIQCILKGSIWLILKVESIELAAKFEVRDEGKIKHTGQPFRFLPGRLDASK